MPIPKLYKGCPPEGLQRYQLWEKQKRFLGGAMKGGLLGDPSRRIPRQEPQQGITVVGTEERLGGQRLFFREAEQGGTI